MVSGGGRGLGRAFCLALGRQGASVVVNNRKRVVDGDGLGPADHIAAEITALGGSALADYSDAASPDCTLNGEYIVTGGGLLRRASPVEWETVALPGGPSLTAAALSALVAESGRGKPREFGVSADAFTDLVGPTT